MNNIVTANDFLDFYKIILSTNNNISLSEDMIYDSLIKINIPEDQFNIDINSLFEEWKNKFNKLDVIMNNDYIEFSSKELSIPSPIKIYVPMDYNHIYKNINKILNYLDNTPFQIRISKNVRNDNVIIRLNSCEEVIKLEEFISNNITEGLFKPNPFTYVYNTVGITIDGPLSFNSVISNLIYNYLNSKQDNYNTIQIDDFYNYIIDLYTNIFINLTSYSKMEIPNIYSFLYDEKSIVFYKNILELILKSSEDSFDIKALEKHFDYCNNIDELSKNKTKYSTYNSLILLKLIYNEENDKLIDRINKYIESGNKKYITNEASLRINAFINNLRDNLKNIFESDKTNLNELMLKLSIPDKEFNINLLDTSKKLKDIIKKLSTYYDYKTIIDIIQIYLQTNDLSLFTRENDLREYIATSNMRDEILSILINKKISFSKYCEELNTYIIEDNEEKEEPEEKIENTDEYDLDTHFDITSIMVSAINSYDEDNNKIEETIEEVKVEEETPVVEENKMSVDELFDEISIEDKTMSLEKTSIEKMFDEMNSTDKEELLNKAITETYNKYEDLYNDKKIKFDGFALVNYALTSILEKDDYTSFTRINEARKNISLLSKQDILDIMCNSINYDNLKIDEIDHDKIQEIIRKYLDYLLEVK